MLTTGKRVIRCEEWGRLHIGPPPAPISPEEVEQILTHWKSETGTNPERYFDIRRQSITPRNWVGVVPGDSIQLEVLPPGASQHSSSMLEVLDKNISIMVARAITRRALEFGGAELAGHGDRVQALIGALCHLYSLARRKHVIRRYASYKDELRHPRGRIIFPRQLFESVRRPGYFSSEWVGLDEDTPENRFIKAIFELVRPLASVELRRQVDQILVELDSTPASASPLADWARIRRDRLSQEYLSLIDLAKSIYDGRAPGLFSGLTRSSSGLVYTASAFESFVASEVMCVARSLGMRASAQQGGRYLGEWSGGPQQGRNAFEMVPDIQVWPFEGTDSYVIDTKWKEINISSAQYGISSDDAYQILSYALRFGHTHAILVYPWFSDTAPPEDAITLDIPLANGLKPITLSVVLIPMLDPGFLTLSSRIGALLRR